MSILRRDDESRKARKVIEPSFQEKLRRDVFSARTTNGHT